MMLRKIAALLLPTFLLVSGCSSAPSKQSLTSMSNMEICKRSITEGPMLDAGGRVLMGVLTLGITEIGEQSSANVRDAYLDEARKRGINTCSADEIAKAECANIFPETTSTRFKQCVITATSSISQQLDSANESIREKQKKMGQAMANSLQNTQAQQKQNGSYGYSDLTGCSQLGGVTRCNGPASSTVDLTNCRMLGNVLRCNAETF